MTRLAIAAGLSTALVGLWASYELDVPSGATIVLVQAALFFAAVPFRGRGV
jgi:zinc transport system permease protein